MKVSKYIKNLSEIFAFFILPTLISYYSGKEVGRAIYNTIVNATVEMYRNITKTFPYYTNETYLIRNIEKTGLENILENVLGITFSTFTLIGCSYLYFKYKKK